MKVLMFGWEFPPYNSGGLGVACFGLSRSLASFGVDLTFVLPRRYPFDGVPCDLLFAEEFGSISLRHVDTLLTPYINSNEYHLLKSDSKDGFYGSGLIDEVYRYAGVAGSIASKTPHDVIHAHDWLSFLAGIEAKKRSGKPLVVHVHATEFDRVGSGSVNAQVYAIEKEGMEKADRVIAVSQFTKNLIVEHYGIDEKKITVVHNGVDEQDFVTETSTPVFLRRLKDMGEKIVLFVGRITLQKGPDYFVEVAKEILQHAPNTYFVVAGSGDMEGAMLQAIARAGLSQRFLCTGFLRGDDLSSIYGAADLFIMPSVSEPFGIAPLEAVMYGAPVLISKQAGVSEVLSSALKSDFWDIHDMANKAVAVLRHPSLQHDLSSGAREQIKGISWKEAAEKCIAMYNKLVHA